MDLDNFKSEIVQMGGGDRGAAEDTATAITKFSKSLNDDLQKELPDGTVDYIGWIMGPDPSASEASRSQRIAEIFSYFDKDGDGFLNQAEFTTMYQRCCYKDEEEFIKVTDEMWGETADGFEFDPAVGMNLAQFNARIAEIFDVEDAYAIFRTFAPMTEVSASVLAAALGLGLGGAGTAFSGAFATKGLYAYDKASGNKYAGMAFFGTGGTRAEQDTPVKAPKYRPAK